MITLSEALRPSPTPDLRGSQEERALAVLMHLSGIVASVVVPLIGWVLSQDKPGRSFLSDQAREALNFQVTVLLAYVACWVLSLLVIGFALLPLVWIANMVFCIVAAVRSYAGTAYRYPFALRFVR